MAPSTDGIGNLLQLGTTYLFATRNTTGEGWYHLISHPSGSKVITEDTSLTSIELKTVAQNDEKVQKLQEAYKSEILLEVVRKRIEEEEMAKIEVEKEKAKDEALLRSIGDGMIVTDESGRILFINRPAENLFGWKNEEVVGKINREVFVAEDDKEAPIGSGILDTILRGEKFSMSGLMKKKNATYLPVAISAAPVIFGSKVTGAIILIRDVTEEKKIDRAKNEFVALASHQLRTPLSIINWYSDGLLTGTVGTTDDERHKYLEGIYRANRRMIELVDALLNVSRIDLGTLAIKPEPLSIKDITVTIMEEFEPPIKSKRLIVNMNFQDNL